MTSPYASTLLQEPSHPDDARTATFPRPQQGPVAAHTVVPRPQPQQMVHAPQYLPAQPAVYVTEQPAAPGGGRGASLLLPLIVIIVGAVALVGGYFATKQASPSAEEVALTTDAAAQQAYTANRQRAVQTGRADAVQASSVAGSLRASMARSSAYNSAYQRGLAAGLRSYRAPVYRGGGGGYRAPSYSFGGPGAVAGAVGIAQNIANATGAPVDVEVY